jgi:hypothetical protein
MLVGALFCVGVSQVVSSSLKDQVAKTPPERKWTSLEYLQILVKYSNRRSCSVRTPTTEAKDQVAKTPPERKFWERNPLGIDLFTHDVFMQKLEYIHWNPVRAGSCSLPEEYYFSSAKFYHTGIDDFGMLTHC